MNNEEYDCHMSQSILEVSENDFDWIFFVFPFYSRIKLRWT